MARSDEPDEERALDAVRRHIAAGVVAVDPEGSALQAVPIYSPDGDPAGWFVAFVAGDQVRGFAQLGPDLGFHRSSTFGLRQSVAEWLDPDHAVEVASNAMRAGEQPARPFLSYDGSPDRLGWIVPVRDAEGNSRRLMVAGQSVFELAGSNESTVD